MKMRTLFELFGDADEISDLFSKVETPEQMISMLERLKKPDAARSFLDSIHSLRLSLHAAMEDTFELGGPVGGNIEEDDEEDFLRELGSVDKDLLDETDVEENQNQAAENVATDIKS